MFDIFEDIFDSFDSFCKASDKLIEQLNPHKEDTNSDSEED